MSDQGSLLDADFDRQDTDSFMRLNQLDLTPVPVVEQFVRDRLVVTPNEGKPVVMPRVWDPCAGYGAFGLALRRHRPELTRIGSEPVPWPNRERHYDSFYDGTFQDVVKRMKDEGGLDVIITNPAFRIWQVIHELAQDVLRPGGKLIMLGTNAWGQRSKDGLARFNAWNPKVQHRIPGTICFRNGKHPKTGKKYGADTRSYCWWEFEKGHHEAGWISCNLPRLPSSHRKWKVKPGTEEA